MEPVVPCDQPEGQFVALGPALGVHPDAIPPLFRCPIPEREVRRAERFEQGKQLVGGLGRAMELVDPPVLA
jgi:hypothetical protein